MKITSKTSIETPKRYSVKNSDKTQNHKTIIADNRYEVLSDSDESDANRYNNDNYKLSHMSRQAYHHGN